MIGRRLGAALAALVVLPAMMAHADADPEAGHRLFTGQDGTGALRSFPCHRCHGRDGRGGVEGGVPDIAALAASYDAASLLHALRSGSAADGRDLSRLMPRYATIDLAAARSLLGYLHALPAQDRRGIAPDRVTFAVLRGPDATYSDLLRAAFQAEVPGGRMQGRTVRFVTFDTIADAAASAVAVVGPAEVAALDPASALGLPVLFPRWMLGGDEDASLVRGLSSSGQDVAAAIAADLRAEGRAGFAHASDVPEKLGADLRLELGDAVDAAVRLVAEPVVPAPPPAPVQPDGRQALAYLFPQAMTQSSAWQAAGWQVRLVLDAPDLVEAMLAHDLDPRQAHAMRSAGLLHLALRKAGRDLTRTGLFDALSEADLSGFSLNYATRPLTGTDAVAILPLN